jgi:uncharacterized protein YbjT (DUF2867 family)
MKIAVVGANGRTGRIVVREALARGHHVVAIAPMSFCAGERLTG